MINQLRKAFPFNRVKKIIKESPERSAIYSIDNAGQKNAYLTTALGKLDDLNIRWKFVGDSIHCWKEKHA